jgi:proteasome lid subunit RPN8/RPN11
MTEPAPVRLQFSARQADTLRREAVAAYPHECCGLLVGEGAGDVLVTDVVAATNTAGNPSRRFTIDPQAHFDLLRTARGNGRRVVGHYHSHPDGGATPSPHDLAMAHDSEAIWVVMTTSAGTASVPRAFRHLSGENGFIELPIVILTCDFNQGGMGYSS